MLLQIRLELWDTAGMERYRTIYNSYYHSAHGVMCVYDMTNEKSFENLEHYWLKEIKQNAPPNAVLMIVGNKADLEENKQVDRFVLTTLGTPFVDQSRRVCSELYVCMHSDRETHLS